MAKKPVKGPPKEPPALDMWRMAPLFALVILIVAAIAVVGYGAPTTPLPTKPVAAVAPTKPAADKVAPDPATQIKELTGRMRALEHKVRGLEQTKGWR